jgi:creatinine amidohydrolase
LQIAGMSWREVEQYLARDDRAVLPLGSTEQHAGLSLATDTLLAERVAVEAAEPLGVPVFPALAYGVTPYFMAFPGTVTLAPETYLRVLAEILESLAAHGFRRIVVVNGHGGNSFAQTVGWEFGRRHPGSFVKFHNWWNAPATWEKVQQAAPVAGHASWMENFPWTRLPSTDASLPAKPAADMAKMRMLAPAQVREQIGDGNLGGVYQLPDAAMDAIWRTGVEETRHAIAADWPAPS